MHVLFVQAEPWERVLEIRQMVGNRLINPHEFQIDNWVIIKVEGSTDLAKIVRIEEIEDVKEETTKEETDVDREKSDPCILIRKADERDLQKIALRQDKKKEAMTVCEELVKKRNLPIKLIDVHFSYDGGRIIFAFRAGSRIDFRDLVKDLAQKFHKSIKMYQVGARQEVERAGDIGPCGQSLCCRSFLKKLGNIQTELIFDQQIAHRGIDRLSGICGKLKCCLNFEEKLYKELMENFPAIGSQIKTPKGEGVVKKWRILKQTVIVEIDKDTVVEVPINEVKK